MKRFAFILSALLLFSCSKDENDSGKPDPIIGSWTLFFNNSDNYSQTRTFNEDGTADMIEYSLPDDPYYYTWENPNDNFDSVTQSYILNLDGNTE